MKIERHADVIRFALIYLAVTMGVIAAWILIAPRGFYDDFPVGPSAWVAALPPYNEHLIRDFGSAGLGLAVVAGLAAVWMERRLVQATALAVFVGSLPHTLYHSTTFESQSTGDNIVSFGGLVLQTLLPLAILYLATGARQDPAPSGAPRPTTAGSGPGRASA